MYQEQAIEKLKNELKGFSGGPKEKAVSKPVAETLEMFCRQDDEFAQAIVENEKTLSDCCKKSWRRPVTPFRTLKFISAPFSSIFLQPTLK